MDDVCTTSCVVRGRSGPKNEGPVPGRQVHVEVAEMLVLILCGLFCLAHNPHKIRKCPIRHGA